MAIQLTAPRMGEGIEELTLVKWIKVEGDVVQELEPIVEMETDKVATELPSPAAGMVLKVLVKEGTIVKVGDILAWIGEPGEKVPSSSKTAAAKKPPEVLDRKKSAKINKQPAARDDFLSPLVRKMIQEHRLDTSKITGTGRDGRITKQDVLAALDTQGISKVVPEPAVSPSSATEPAASGRGVQPISSIRRTIAERMMHSLNTSAHVLTVMEADLSRVQAHRTFNKPLFEQDGVRLTLTAYFIAAIVSGLKTNPKVNSSWTDAGLVIHPEINIGMAVSLGQEGLIVPVIKRADTLSLLGIARQINDLAERARSKKLLPEEVRGGTFSLTNHGMSSSLFASPIITQPQVGILGTGLVQKRAVVVTDPQGSDSIAIRPMVYLSFVFDHRVLDGEGADLFLGTVRDTLEGWK